MFENFGIKDVFAMAKKFVIILAALLIVSILCSAFSFIKDKDKHPQQSGDNNWATSAYFEIQSAEANGSMTIEQRTETENVRKRLAATYKSLITSDMANDYVYRKLITQLSPEEIIKRAELGITAEQFDASKLKSMVKCEIPEQTTVLNLYVTSKDKELSKIVVDIYAGYMENDLQKSVKEDSLRYMGGATQIVVDENKSILSGQSKSKTVIMNFIIAVAVYLLFVVCYAFFRPTLNRKSDFEQYGVRVIAELK